MIDERNYIYESLTNSIVYCDICRRGDVMMSNQLSIVTNVIIFPLHTCFAVVPLNGPDDRGYLELGREDQHQRLGVSAALDHVLDDR